ncbi:MAG TPA: cellulase family glycosylhydrolase [Armatimonadota bacterium]|jgi:aryl-phospho-beta-D-glucosidase BglC (GH1 family)
MFRIPLVLAAAAALASAALAKPGIPAARLNRLNHGINLGAYRYSDAAVTPELARALRKAGFRHVRLPVDPSTLLNPDDPAALNPAGVAKLNATLDVLLKAGFAVSVDMHDPDKRIWNDDAWGDRFVAFWGAMAKELSRRDPERLFMEVANEPTSDDPAHWAALQARCLAAMRKAAPRHTLVATPNMCITAGNWDVKKVLETFRPVADRNVLYTFHYYNPFLFTHQGATWSWDGVKGLSGIPYPSSPAAVAAAADRYPEPQKDYITQYGSERWDAKKLVEDMRFAVDWARKYGVAINLGEFGAYRNGPEDSRLRWLHDARGAAEGYKVPWTIWDDGGGFGVTNGRDANLNAGALKALFGPR